MPIISTAKESPMLNDAKVCSKQHVKKEKIT